MTNKVVVLIGVVFLGVGVFALFKTMPRPQRGGEPVVTGNEKVEPGQMQIKFPEYDNVTGKIKSMLTGEKAVQVDGGMMRITEMRLETYQYQGETRKIDLIIEAPECLFSFRTHVASSDGPMTLRRADGDASLSGRGFEWRQKESALTISNNVKTVTRKGFSINE